MDSKKGSRRGLIFCLSDAVAPPGIDGLPPAELQQSLLKLLEENAEQERVIGEPHEEIARLKGLKRRPSIQPPRHGERRHLCKTRSCRVASPPRLEVEDQIVKAEVAAGLRFLG